MLISFHCLDKSDHVGLIRQDKLGDHLAWVEKNMDAIKVAGPLKADNQIVGSLYILEANDCEDAKKILAQDPYYQAKIWQVINVKEFNAYAGNWVGGKNWPDL